MLRIFAQMAMRFRNLKKLRLPTLGVVAATRSKRIPLPQRRAPAPLNDLSAWRRWAHEVQRVPRLVRHGRQRMAVAQLTGILSAILT